MPYSIPTPEQFRARFLEFADKDDAKIELVINDASRFVSEDWPEQDYQPAILFLAAHMLWTEEIAEVHGMSLSGVSNISYSPMSIGLSPSKVTGDLARILESSPYLQRYWMIYPFHDTPIVLDGRM